jgi:(E)-4-hydroxy-3-methylbut-2-enyl-diphosphate synthase
VWEAGLFEEHDFHDFKISVKHNDPVVMVRAYELLAEAGDWPLHLGVTEAGPGVPGHDQVRDRLRGPALAGASATRSGSRSRRPRSRRSRSASRSCSRSTCAPASSRSSPARPAGGPRSTSTSSPRRSPPASTGSRCRCASPSWAASSTVPGEAREADLGVASGNGKGQIFVKGEVIKTVPESQIVETLIEEAMRIAEDMEPVEGGAAEVSVS